MKNSAQHGHGKVALKITMTVPVQHGDGIAGLYTGGFQGVSQLLYSLSKVAITERLFTPINYLVIGFKAAGRSKNLFDQKRIGLGIVSPLQHFYRHHTAPVLKGYVVTVLF